MLESDYIFVHTLLGTGDAGKMERAVNEILRHQNDDGGWSIYPGGPSNISAWREGLFRAEADGLVAGSSGAGEGARVDSGAWRRGRVQHLHQDLSLLLRAV